MNTTRPPRTLRAQIITRDQNRCADCRWSRGPWPDTDLEVDHDIEIQDGGTNDPDNLVTRCIPHHRAKTEEARMARQAVAAGKKPAPPKAATGQPPTPPAYPWRVPTGAALIAGAVFLPLHTYLPQYQAHPITAWVLVAATTTVVWAARYVHWRREDRAHRVFGMLAKVTDTAPAARRLRFKVRTWDGFTPTVVRIQPGPGYLTGGPEKVEQLARVFCAATGAHAVVSKPSPSGWVTITASDDAPAPANHAAIQSVETVAAEPSPATAAVVDRITDALNAVVDTDAGTVHVTSWHDDGTPAVIDYVYPPKSTSKIGENLVRFRGTITRLYPPTAGDWYLEWRSVGDRLRFEDRPDPLAPKVPLPDQDPDADLYEGVTIGVTDDGEPWKLPMMGGSHWLVAGASGAGKGSILWGVLRGLEPFIKDGRVRLWVVDPKGGAEFDAAEPFAHAFAVTPQDCNLLLGRARATMLAKAASMRGEGRKLDRPTSERPLDVLIVDELANITAYVEPKVGRENADHLAALCSMGRAAGFTVIAAVQDPRKEIVRNRGLFTAAVALRLSEPGEVNLVLGSGVRAQGATADLIPKAHPGIGYMIRDGHAGAVRARAAFISDEEIARIARALTPEPPAHTPPRVGTQLELPAASPEGPREWMMRALGRVPEDLLVLLPDDTDPVRLVSWEDDPDDPDDRIEVTYVYDGESQERQAPFMWDDVVVEYTPNP